MARTAVPVAEINRNPGVAPTAPVAMDAANGNAVANNGHTWIEVSNGDAAQQTVTVHPIRTVDGQSVAGVAHLLAAGAGRRLGPFPVEDYGASLEVDTTSANVTIAAYRL